MGGGLGGGSKRQSKPRGVNSSRLFFVACLGLFLGGVKIFRGIYLGFIGQFSVSGPLKVVVWFCVVPISLDILGLGGGQNFWDILVN